MDLNVSANIIKHLDENIGVNLHDLRLSNGSLDIHSKV